jgi:carbon monoxide dehydrogenase subunit G
MTGILVSTVIDAPPERVWAVVEQIERHTDWMADADAIRFVGEQRRGVGTTMLVDTKVGPIKLVDHMEVVEWDDGRAIGVRHAGVVSGTGRFTIEPTGAATRFAWQETLRFPWWLGGRLGEAIGGRIVLKAIWRRNLSSLKRLVETGGA